MASMAHTASILVCFVMTWPAFLCRVEEVTTTVTALTARSDHQGVISLVGKALLQHEGVDDRAQLLAYLARAHAYLGHHEESMGAYEQLIALSGVSNTHLVWEAFVNNGRAFHRVAYRPDTAVAVLQAALNIRPDHPAPLYELCYIHMESRNPAGLRKWAKRILKLDPNNLIGLNYLSDSYSAERKNKEASVVSAKLLQLEPRLCSMTAAHISYLNSQFEWKKAVKHAATLKETILQERCASSNTDGSLETGKGWFAGTGMTLSSLFLPSFDGALLRRIAEADSRNDVLMAYEELPGGRLAAPKFTMPSFVSLDHSAKKFRIGFLSGNGFQAMNPTLGLIQDLFSYPDQRVFETMCFSQLVCEGVPDSPARARILATCGSYHCQPGTQSHRTAEEINRRGVHALLELSGHTKNKQFGPLVFRPVPVQLHFLEFPSTIGATFVDFFITAVSVLPPEFDGYMSEHLLRLPYTHFMNGYMHREEYKNDLLNAAAEPTLDPNSPPVLCSYNNPVKLVSEDVAGWLRVMKRVPAARLHILAPINKVQGDLGRMLREVGVSEERVTLFPPYPTNSKYLAGLGACDLFLDSTAFNAGVTALDAWWRGVPVLSLPGRLIAQRVSGALGQYMCSGETVAHTPEELEELAVSLLEGPRKLPRLRQKVRSCKLTSPVFSGNAIYLELERALVAATEMKLAPVFGTNFHYSAPVV